MKTTLITGGLVVDGTGADPFRSNVLIADGHIELLGESVVASDLVVDAEGLLLTPGFIDIHTHSDLSRFAYPLAESRILQGVTTEVSGNCGLTPAPVPDDDVEAFRASIGPIDVVPHIPLNWQTTAEYLDALQEVPSATNIVPLIGHGSLRFFAMGSEPNEPNGDQEVALKTLVTDALNEGYWGLSLGLMYSPGEYANIDELASLAQIIADHGATLSVHMRNYDDEGLVAAVAEVIAIAERTNVSVQISHLRSVSDPTGNTLAKALELLNETSANVSADAYPYLAGHTTIMQLLPEDLRAAGVQAAIRAITADRTSVAEQIIEQLKHGPEDITIVRAGETDSPVVGNTLKEIAERESVHWSIAMVNLIEQYDGLIDVIVVGTREIDAETVLKLPYVSVASDGVALHLDHKLNIPHPRSTGTFSKAFRELVDGGMSIAETIRKMTSQPAQKIGLRDRGVVRNGSIADLVLFDPQQFTDNATYAEPLLAPTGVHHVWVNGVAVVTDGLVTGNTPGALLRRPNE